MALDATTLRVGHVVLARIPDPDGNPLEGPHPAMVLRGPASNGELYLVGITSSFSQPLERHAIELPWSEHGHPETGLQKPCVIKCRWVVRWKSSNLMRRIGRLPPEIVERVLDYVVAAVEEKRTAPGKSSLPGEHRQD